jgi:hypothetical protein
MERTLAGPCLNFPGIERTVPRIERSLTSWWRSLTGTSETLAKRWQILLRGLVLRRLVLGNFQELDGERQAVLAHEDRQSILGRQEGAIGSF